MKPETVPLGEACTVVMGQSPPGTSYNTSGDGLPFFQGKTDFGEIYPKVRVFCNQPSRIADEGDILMSVRAPVGPTNLAKEKCCIGRGLAALRTGDRLDTSFLFYFLRHHEPRLASQGQGSTFDAINRDDLEEIEIPFPGLPEQRRIAGQLEQADRLRRTRRYALELTDTFLPAAFPRLFGDPIENPHGSRVEPLEDLIQPTRPISYGILMPGPDVPAGVPYIRVTDIQDGQVVTALIRRTTQEIDQAYKRSKLKAGDLLLSIRGQVGRMAIVPPCLDGANITQDTARLATVDAVESHYLMGCLASRGMQHRMIGLTRGAAVQGINLGDVKKLPIPVPPLPLQQKFAALVERVECLRAVQREALRQAEHLFASLLDRAFSG